MKISLDQDKCVGCGVCCQVCPDVFSLDEKVGTAKILRLDDEAPCIKEAMESCPVNCIKMGDGV